MSPCFAQQSCSTMSSSIIMPYIGKGKPGRHRSQAFPKERGPGAHLVPGPPIGPRQTAHWPSCQWCSLSFILIGHWQGNPFKGLSIPYWPYAKASTAQTAHLWSRQLGLRGGPNPSRFTAVAKAAGKIPFVMQALTHRCTVGTIDDSACTTPQAKFMELGQQHKEQRRSA